MINHSLTSKRNKKYVVCGYATVGLENIYNRRILFSPAAVRRWAAEGAHTPVHGSGPL